MCGNDATYQKDAYISDIFYMPSVSPEQMKVFREIVENRLRDCPLILPKLCDDNGNELLNYTPLQKGQDR